MKPFDVFITYISWDGGGKERPVLAFILSDEIVDIYQITTKYEGKSDVIKSQYFKIDDWKQAGLTSQSHIDTGTLIGLSMATFKNKTPIGKLTDSDKQRLLAFLLK